MLSRPKSSLFNFVPVYISHDCRLCEEGPLLPKFATGQIHLERRNKLLSSSASSLVAKTISLKVVEESSFHTSRQRALKLSQKAETPLLPPLSRVTSERHYKPCLRFLSLNLILK